MRKTNLYLVALSALALATGCSSDETTGENYGNVISFNAVAGKSTRAVATTTNSIDNFKVYAFTKENAADTAIYKTYMDGVIVTKTGNAWDYDNHQFWPSTAVNFFAISPSTTKVNNVEDDSVNTVSINGYFADGSTDLLYSATMDATESATPVQMNFRHALSQVVFKLRNSNTKGITVNVKDITISGIAHEGNFSWANGTTGTLTTSDTETDSTWGTWDLVFGKYSYSASVDSDPITLTSDAVFLKSADGDNGAFFLMPQTLVEWDKKGTGYTNNGARVLVNCQIFDTTSGIQLWPATEGEYANVAIPLSNPTNDPNRTPDENGKDAKHDKWMQGKQYIYTIVFGEGAGYNPDPTDPDNPEPVIVPIDFDVITVDEFQDGGSYDADGATE